MNGNGRDFDNDLLNAWMAAYDEALAGKNVAVPDVPVDSQEVREVKDCLDLLNSKWPRARPEGDGTPPIGRFRILRTLGRGGCGVVFLAFDPVLKREVALKVPRPEVLFDGDLRHRFLREARAAAGLQHPNVVTVYEAGEAGPVCYIASAYCPGGNLAEWLRGREEPVPLRVAAGLVAVIARAAHYTHTRGVVHRDLKPSNILLEVKEGCAMPGEGTPEHAVVFGTVRLVPRITDFGLARLREAITDLTHTGNILGTLCYMAPEQAQGRRAEVGPATDTYALGCILYEMLVGQPPLRGASHADTLRLLLDTEPVAPSRLRHDVPRDLETVCLKCLEKDPRRRYASASALADDLERWLRGEPVRVRRVGLVGHGWRWCRRKPVVAILLAALVFTVTAGFTASVTFGRQAANNEARALKGEALALENLHNEEAARQESDEHYARLRGMLGNVIQQNVTASLRTQDPNFVRETMLTETESCLTSLVQRHDQDAKLRVLLANVLAQLGALRFAQDKDAEAQAYFERAARLWERFPAGEAHESQNRAWRAITFAYLEQIFQRQGQSERAQDSFAVAFGIWRELAKEPTSPQGNAFIVNSLLDIAWAFVGNASSGEEVARRLEIIRDRLHRLGGGPECDLFLDCVRVGLCRAEAQKQEAAQRPEAVLAAAREAASLVAALLGRSALHRNTRNYLAAVALQISMYLRRAEAPEEALRLSDQANRVVRELLREAPDEPNLLDVLGTSWDEIAKVRWALHQPAESLAASRNALAAQQRVLAIAPAAPGARTHLDVHYVKLGRKLCQLGRLEEAEACFREREALWPGDAGKHAEALQELQKRVAQFGDDKEQLSPEEQQERQRYLDLSARLERNGAGTVAPTPGARP